MTREYEVGENILSLFADMEVVYITLYKLELIGKNKIKLCIDAPTKNSKIFILTLQLVDEEVDLVDEIAIHCIKGDEKTYKGKDLRKIINLIKKEIKEGKQIKGFE